MQQRSLLLRLLRLFAAQLRVDVRALIGRKEAQEAQSRSGRWKDLSPTPAVFHSREFVFIRG
jgi:hypothetical protein